MKRALLPVLVLAFALAACGQAADKAPAAPAAPEASDANALHIETGRYAVMLQQVGELTAERSGAGELETTDPRRLARTLREVVWSYNLDRSRLCGRNLFADVACGSAYEPVWISEPAEASPTLAELQTRSSAVGEEVMRFWNAVCADARTRATDEAARGQICAIE